jgi:hypothetical protein
MPHERCSGPHPDVWWLIAIGLNAPTFLTGCYFLSCFLARYEGQMKKILGAVLILTTAFLLAFRGSYADSLGKTKFSSEASSLDGDHYQSSGVYGSDASMDTKPVYFDMGTFKYKVPRNYIIDMGEGLVTIKATFPGFHPLTDKTADCLTKPYLYLPKGCFPVTFWFEVGKTLGDPPKKFVVNGETFTDVDEWHFKNASKIFRSQKPKQGPAGFEMYEAGRDIVQTETYRKKSKLHTILIHCYMHGVMDEDGVEDKNAQTCSNLHSPLPRGGAVSYRVRHDQLSDVERIDTGIRNLLSSFIVKGEKQ